MENNMNWSNLRWVRSAGLVVGLLANASVYAHTGHGTSNLLEGLVHPIGLDHLLAIVAVGLWSVRALSAGSVWQGPVTFLAALTVGAALGVFGWQVIYLEQMVALSTVMFGFMLVVGRSVVPVSGGLMLIASAAVLHGMAHGLEAPPTEFAPYAIGFLITTAVLHICGATVAKWIVRFWAAKSQLAFTGLGTAFGGAGLYLFTQL
jgi:urease accessory protein